MTEQEKTKLYLEKLTSYFTDIQKALKHLEEVVVAKDTPIKDENLLIIKATCGSLYLCIFYLNQISIVATSNDLMKLSKIIEKTYTKYKPLIDKLQSETANKITKSFKDKGLTLVEGNTTLQ